MRLWQAENAEKSLSFSTKKFETARVIIAGSESAKGERNFKKSVLALVAGLKKFRKEPPKGRYLDLKEILALGGASLGVSFITNIANMYVTVGQLPLIYERRREA